MKLYSSFALPIGLLAASSLFIALGRLGGDADAPADAAKEGETPAPLVLEIDSAAAAQLHRIAIHPESLCAVGLTPAQAASVIEAGAAHFEQYAELCQGADADYAAARVARDELQRTVRSGLASQQEVADLADAKVAMASAEAERAAAFDAAFDAATLGLDGEVKALLATIRANESWRLPVAYLVADRSQADWVTLRDALVAERLAAEEQTATPEPYASFLATTESNADVAAALTGLETHLAELQAAWDAALDQE
ncbi:MAG TPA: hypothetical protein VJP77_02970 [Planctomycetota bacterium]|nr:hypothetical protein [Planctomycetota bacterium]